MTEGRNSKQFALEERTFTFAKNTALLVKRLPGLIYDQEYGRQAVRASGSVGANDIEANEALSRKDFSMSIKICRGEAEETAYWLRLIMETNDEKYTLEASGFTAKAWR
jgi:four helix bundle protein